MKYFLSNNQYLKPRHQSSLTLMLSDSSKREIKNSYAGGQNKVRH